ncbi:HEPN domain-containing protein, partial [Patescibacteria group bacterium]|nr:HEPN domain-containing protein [Patescibacteria group bacterium]
KHENTKTRKHENTKTRKHENTKTRKHENTKTRKHENTKTRKHENTNIKKCFRVLRRSRVFSCFCFDRNARIWYIYNMQKQLNEQMDYWKQSAQKNLDAAKVLFDNKHYDSCLFFRASCFGKNN